MNTMLHKKIDDLMYTLYGITDEEIRIVEGMQQESDSTLHHRTRGLSEQGDSGQGDFGQGDSPGKGLQPLVLVYPGHPESDSTWHHRTRGCNPLSICHGEYMPE